MSAEIWRSEIVAYGFMFLNLAVVATGLWWAWRRDMMFGKQDEVPGLGPEAPVRENRHG